MRAFEFYQQKNLLEQESSQVKQILQRIANNVEKNPASAAKVADMLSAMNDAADKAIALNKDKEKQTKITPPSQQNQPERLVASLDEAEVNDVQKAKAEANELSSKADNMILAFGIDPKNKKQLLKMLQSIEEETIEKKHQEDLAYEAEQGDAIALLAGKITGTLEKIRDHYNHKAALRKAVIDEQPEAVEKYEMILLRGKPDTPAIAEEVKTLVTGTLEWFKRTYKEKEAREKYKKDSLKFIRACEKGIINLGSLLKQGSGNFIDEIPKEYAWVRETKLVDQLLKLKPSGSGAGNWGPGEMGLAILGKPVNKDSKKGDLQVGDKKFELKASAKATQGGRVNTEAVMVGKDGQADFIEAWDEFSAKLAPGSIVMSGEKIAFANLEDKPKEIRSKDITRTSIGPTWIAIVNSALKRSKVSESDVSSFLGKVLTAPISPMYKSKVKYNTASLATTTEEGVTQINEQNLLGEYLKQTLTFYNETDDVEDILVVNPSDGHFEVINATDTEGLQAKINTGAIQTSTTWIDFKDKQSKAGPQIGTASPKPK